jgi:hypothetical protein
VQQEFARIIVSADFGFFRDALLTWCGDEHEDSSLAEQDERLNYGLRQRASVCPRLRPCVGCRR